MMADYQFSVIIPTWPMMPEAILDAAQNSYGGIAPHEFVLCNAYRGQPLLSCGDLLAEHCTPRVHSSLVFCPRTMVQPIQSLTVAGDCLDCLLPLHETYKRLRQLGFGETRTGKDACESSL